MKMLGYFRSEGFYAKHLEDVTRYVRMKWCEELLELDWKKIVVIDHATFVRDVINNEVWMEYEMNPFIARAEEDVVTAYTGVCAKG